MPALARRGSSLRPISPNPAQPRPVATRRGQHILPLPAKILGVAVERFPRASRRRALTAGSRVAQPSRSLYTRHLLFSACHMSMPRPALPATARVTQPPRPLCLCRCLLATRWPPAPTSAAPPPCWLCPCAAALFPMPSNLWKKEKRVRQRWRERNK